MSDTYIELCRSAKHALHDLLSATEPDMGYKLRTAYSDLKTYIAQHENGEIGDDPEPEPERWADLPLAQREAQVVEFVGEQRPTIGELAIAMRKALHVDYSVYESQVRNVVNRLYKAGKLAREGEQWHSRVRYRYYVPRELEGPIAELQRQFDSDDAGGGVDADTTR